MQATWIDPSELGALPLYHQNAYIQLFASAEGAQAKMALVDGPQGPAYFPVLLRDLGQGIFEATTVYGYGGFYSPDALVLEAGYLQCLRTFLAEQGLACAFVRHSPFLSNQLSVQDFSELNRYTYVRQLRADQNLEQFCASIPQKLRWSVNYALRHGLSVQINRGTQIQAQDVEEFYRIYRSLMEDKGTGEFYLFSAEFFQNHVQLLGDQCFLASVRDPESGQMIAAAFYLIDDLGWVHYHLSASLREFLKVQPVELLMAQAMVYFGQLGLQFMHLGGGHSVDQSDGLSRFKKKFADQVCEFHISKWILDQNLYQRAREAKDLQNPHFFLVSDARGPL